jgi:hypothetical protein
MQVELPMSPRIVMPFPWQGPFRIANASASNPHINATLAENNDWFEFDKRPRLEILPRFEMLKASPYALKLESAGLFIKALQTRAPQLSALLQAHLGNNIAENGRVTRMAQLATSAPALDWNKLDQIAALPLGGRVKLNAWDDRVEIVKAQPVAITSARDKMPFEVTPFFPRLSRYSVASTPAATTSAAATTAKASPTPTN